MLRSGAGAVSGRVAGGGLLARPHVVVGEPIRGEEGELQGLLAGVIDLDRSELDRVLDAFSTSEGRFVEVIDAAGEVLDAAGTASADSAEDSMRATAALSVAPWRVVVGQPQSRALASLVRFQRALWSIGLALVAGVGVVVAPMLNRFVGAIRELTAAAEAVARGDLSRPVAVRGRGDELATLASSFEQMRVELARSRLALERQLDEREQLIRQLVTSNEELRTAQARLIETERFAAIGELSAAVAHGIRNPLAGIKAAAQLASLDLDDAHPLRENVRDIVTEVDKLESRVKTLLDFAKPFEPRLAPARLASIVDGAVASLRSQIAGRGIELVVDLDPALPETRLDAAQIEQVVLALLSNAAEAIEGGGRIEIRGSAGDGRLRLEIADTGSGIPADQLDRVFRLFFTTKSYGTGIGLAVVKKIVERHGGSIAVSSEVGKGTRFAIELPLEPEAA
jgi:signal transduction histidine kinase